MQGEVIKRGFGGTWGCSSYIPVRRLCLHALMRLRCEKPGIIPVLESDAPRGDKVPAPRKEPAASLSA